MAEFHITNDQSHSYQKIIRIAQLVDYPSYSATLRLMVESLKSVLSIRPLKNSVVKQLSLNHKKPHRKILIMELYAKAMS